ncbi:MAG: methionine adenosyltransferase [Planctomycetota bacterium]|nr:MAG: methionine adenosyltransferase [Planctomycetota bacterium]
MARGRHLFTSESVAMGHPDKVADQISDSILDAIIAKDKNARVACETMVTTGVAIVAGEITTKTYADIPQIVRNTIAEIGYTDASMGFDSQTCAVITSIDKQSPDIAMGVDESEDREQGAGDQGIMFGFAIDETPEFMPLPIALAHRLMVKHAEVRQSGTLSFLRPDGKCQVTMEYENGMPQRVHTIVFATQHSDDIETPELRKQVIDKIILPCIPAELVTGDIIYHINATGRFVIGGPQADCGLTGRKIIVDTYGGFGAHGGGAFSGKDPSKVDRSGTYMARYIAKNVVAAGLASRCEVQIAYSIGVAEPISILVDCNRTEKVPEEKIEGLIREVFPLKPRAIIKHLDLLRPIFKETARFGHFGRNLPGFTWEKTDMVDKLKSAAGI